MENLILLECSTCGYYILGVPDGAISEEELKGCCPECGSDLEVKEQA